jgi:hypothetical protein
MAEGKDFEFIQKVLEGKALRELVSILSSLRYGSITLVIQDGKVVQIEKIEKIRCV